jgi:hypothetical protein
VRQTLLATVILGVEATSLNHQEEKYEGVTTEHVSNFSSTGSVLVVFRRNSHANVLRLRTKNAHPTHSGSGRPTMAHSFRFFRS